VTLLYIFATENGTASQVRAAKGEGANRFFWTHCGDSGYYHRCRLRVIIRGFRCAKHGLVVVFYDNVFFFIDIRPLFIVSLVISSCGKQ
jgi:hypothetical protein